jgi:hypothetical protein
MDSLMWMYLIKTLLSALMIVVVTETAKRSGFVGGLIKSLPLISLLSFIWLYFETKDVHKVAALSQSTVWFVIPTLPMFLLFAYLLQQNLDFWPSLGASIVCMFLCYGLTIFILGRLGITL